MGFGAPAPGKLTQKTNAKNESQISAKSGAQKLNKNQNADIKCVKKKTSFTGELLQFVQTAQIGPVQIRRRSFFAAKIYRSASSTAFLRFLSI